MDGPWPPSHPTNPSRVQSFHYQMRATRYVVCVYQTEGGRKRARGKKQNVLMYFG